MSHAPSRKWSSIVVAMLGTFVIGAAGAAAAEPITVVVSKIKDLNLRIYGFAETDFIADTTAGFTEEQDSNLVPMRTVGTVFGKTPSGAANFTGQHHRTEMSVRNSRLGFDLTLPKTDGGLASEAVIELDLMGNNATNTQPGTTPGVQTERDFFNNPAVRVRHAYANLTYNSLNAKIGQYWSLLGWQPYYFPGEVIVQPAVGQLYRRFAQSRLTHTLNVPQDWTLESAADIAKPAQMNSGSPEAHAGLRAASTKYKGASIAGAGSSMVGLSAAVSGAVIPIATNGFGNPTGRVIAFDALVPIIPSKDGADRSNNLIWAGEFVTGSGFGGLEMAGLTMGVPAPTVAGIGSAIDSGIAGINGGGNAELLQARAFRTHVQYSLPGGKWAVSVGCAQIEALNLDKFSNGLNGNNGGLGMTPKNQFGYLSVFYDPLTWFRIAMEINQTRDTYNDPANRYAINNRYQVSTFFVF